MGLFYVNTTTGTIEEVSLGDSYLVDFDGLDDIPFPDDPEQDDLGWDDLSAEELINRAGLAAEEIGH